MDGIQWSEVFKIHTNCVGCGNLTRIVSTQGGPKCYKCSIDNICVGCGQKSWYVSYSNKRIKCFDCSPNNICTGCGVKSTKVSRVDRRFKCFDCSLNSRSTGWWEQE